MFFQKIEVRCLTSFCFCFEGVFNSGLPGPSTVVPLRKTGDEEEGRLSAAGPDDGGGSQAALERCLGSKGAGLFPWENHRKMVV